MVGNKIGGVNVFGGGLPLYASGHKIIGGVGVSGDTSCADHNIAWRVRNILNLDHMAEGDGLKAVPVRQACSPETPLTRTTLFSISLRTRPEAAETASPVSDIRPA